MSGVTSGLASTLDFLFVFFVVKCKMGYVYSDKRIWWSQDNFSCYDFHDRGASQRSCKNGFI